MYINEAGVVSYIQVDSNGDVILDPNGNPVLKDGNGNLVEYGPTERIFKHPLHPYTEALLSAVPVPDPDAKMNRIVLEGSIPSPANPPSGCKFHTRCARCMEICKQVEPVQKEVEPGHFVNCHLYD